MVGKHVDSAYGSSLLPFLPLDYHFPEIGEELVALWPRRQRFAKCLLRKHAVVVFDLQPLANPDPDFTWSVVS